MKILQKNEKKLRQISKEVPLDEIKSNGTKAILEKMAKALAGKENGVALAAPQIGESLRIFIVAGEIIKNEIPPELKEKKVRLKPVVFINPILKKISQKKQIVGEGCLSVEGIYGAIKRAEKVTVEAYDENAKKFTRGVSGLLAQIIQHEMDHLNGILFIDKATKLIENDNE